MVVNVRVRWPAEKVQSDELIEGQSSTLRQRRWTSISSWIGARQLRAQLERQLRDAIRAGRLRAGAKLPPSRVLADELEVSRGVVVDAYSQLVAEG
jgi:hypothetical protein